MRILLGERLEDANMTYEKLAKDSGVSKSTIQRMAAGKNKKNAIEHMELIAKAMDIKISDLYESEYK